MLFEKQEPQSILTCDVCKGTGYVTYRTCNNCHGLSIGMQDDDVFAYFGESLTQYHIRLKRSRRVLNRFRVVGALLFWLSFWGIFGWNVYSNNWFDSIFTIDFWFRDVVPVFIFFWLGVIALSYLVYRMIVDADPEPEMDYKKKEHQKNPEWNLQNMTWIDIRKMKRKHTRNISTYMTKTARIVLEDAYMTAVSYGHSQVVPIHLFYALLSSNQVQGIFLRLGIPSNILQAKLKQVLQTFDVQKGIRPVLSSEAWQIVFHAYVQSRKHKDTRIRDAELLIATVKQSEWIQEVLYDMEIDSIKLTNVVEWARIREKIYEQYRTFRRAASRMSKHGIDRAMTAVATPFLNNFSKDITLQAKYGNIVPCVARDKEIDEIFRIVEAGRSNIMLVGEHGVGKMSIVEGIVQRMISDNAPERLHDKRFVQISTSSLLAGTTVAGAQQRLINIMHEVRRAQNIILFINNIHDLTGMTDSNGEGLDLSESLAEHLSDRDSLMFATTLPDAFSKYIVKSEIGTMFAKVEIKEMDINQAIQVLESKIGQVEYKNNVFFSYDAIERCVVLSKKFMYDQNLPESAIALMTEVAAYVRSNKGENQLVTSADVGEVISDKTGVPVSSISENESEKLMRLEEEMHKQVIGQDLAVQMVAQSLRRSRADIRSQKRPIANFLFLGPTGVGKTELAKTIARVYFGGEERMIRIDMSEYQDKTGIYRLIGQPGQQGTGLLTEAVHRQPFSLILLDELEKADPDILNLFLQVFDDGRLTDSTGQVIDFTNAIIIATSNAGTSYVQDQMNQGVDVETIREHLIRSELKQYYRPEFLNRFDGIVLFKALNREEIKQIAGLMLTRVAKDLETRGVELRVEDAALEALADVGFDPDFGARPMRRAIQDRVENQLAEFILQNKLKRRDVVILGEGAQIRVEQS